MNIHILEYMNNKYLIHYQYDHPYFFIIIIIICEKKKYFKIVPIFTCTDPDVLLY